MLHPTTIRLIDQIEQSYDDHRSRITQAGRDAADQALIDELWAEARAKSQAAHPSRVAARLAASRNEFEATLDATRAEADRLRESLADVIDLDSKRGGRRG